MPAETEINEITLFEHIQRAKDKRLTEEDFSSHHFKITIDKRILKVEPDSEDRDYLKYMQNIVGGYIELWFEDSDIRLWVDEEGRMKGKEPNTSLVTFWETLGYTFVYAPPVGDYLIEVAK